MAMHVPRTGMQTMMKDGAKHYSGLEEAVLRNITACKEMAAVTRTSLGPNGMNKMIVNHLEKLFVTNDAATILNELEVEHPAAKILVMASQRMEEDIGDGTNLVLVLAGELLAQGEKLIKMGLSPSEIIGGFDQAKLKALEIVNQLDLTCYELKDIRDVAEVSKCLRTALGSKQRGFEDRLSSLVAEACISVLPKNPANFNVDNVRIAKLVGAGVESTRVIRGMVFQREVEGVVNSVTGAKVAVFTTGMDIASTETKGTVLLKNAEELMEFSNGEETLVEKEIKQLADAGVNVVVTGGKIGDLNLHFLNKYKIMAVKIASKFELRRLCKTIEATPLVRVGVPMAEELGHCDDVHIEEIGDARVIIFRQEKAGSQVATIVVRGSTQNIMDDVSRAIDDGIKNFKQYTKDAHFLAGGGASEIEIGVRLAKYGAQCPGLEQYAIKSFATALECVPRVLAENSGANASDMLSRLYAAHHAGGIFAGLDVEQDDGCSVSDAAARSIYDLRSTKWWALKLATEAAVTVLRVDQIIMAKPAGGPKLRESNTQDQDDD